MRHAPLELLMVQEVVISHCLQDLIVESVDSAALIACNFVVISGDSCDRPLGPCISVSRAHNFKNQTPGLAGPVPAAAFSVSRGLRLGYGGLTVYTHEK